MSFDWQPGIEHLKNDALMSAVIERIGAPQLGRERDAWRSLSSSIIGQQISVSAARAIRGRFAALAESDYPTPLQVLAADDEALRSVGLSRNKVLAVRDLASHLEDGRIHAARFDEMDDEAIIAELSAVRGIGRWTAQMYLLFSLQRPDVWAIDDLGLRHGVRKLHGLEAMPGKKEMESLGAIWSPWRSLASWYLWRSLENEPEIAVK